MINAVAFSNVGNVRSNHEDNFLLGQDQFIEITTQNKMINSLYTHNARSMGTNGIFVVCDGMGGHLAGEIASYCAVKWINSKYDLILQANKEQLMQCVSDLNQYIYDYSEKHYECRNMGSTITSLVIADEIVYSINAGDSRTYCFNGGSFYLVTEDHTEGQRLKGLNLLTEDELEAFPYRKNLYKYLGRKGTLIADVKDISFKSNDIYLLCSDGLTDALTEREMEIIFREHSNINDIGENLMQSALIKGNKCSDNVTIILIERK